MSKLGSNLPKPSPLLIHLDAESRRTLDAAAKLRRISVSAFVRTVSVAQARREVAGAEDGTVQPSPDEQLAFWQALQEPAKLTAAQRRLGALMQGTR